MKPSAAAFSAAILLGFASAAPSKTGTVCNKWPAASDALVDELLTMARGYVYGYMFDDKTSETVQGGPGKCLKILNWVEEGNPPQSAAAYICNDNVGEKTVKYEDVEMLIDELRKGCKEGKDSWSGQIFTNENFNIIVRKDPDEKK